MYNNIDAHYANSHIAVKKQYYYKSEVTNPKTDHQEPHSAQSYHLPVS